MNSFYKQIKKEEIKNINSNNNIFMNDIIDYLKSKNKYLTLEQIEEFKKCLKYNRSICFAAKYDFIKEYLHIFSFLYDDFSSYFLEITNYYSSFTWNEGIKERNEKLNKINELTDILFDKVKIDDTGSLMCYKDFNFFEVCSINDFMIYKNFTNEEKLIFENKDLIIDEKIKYSLLFANKIGGDVLLGFLYINDVRMIYPLVALDNFYFDLVHNVYMYDVVFDTIFRFEPLVLINKPYYFFDQSEKNLEEFTVRRMLEKN